MLISFSKYSFILPLSCLFLEVIISGNDSIWSSLFLFTALVTNYTNWANAYNGILLDLLLLICVFSWLLFSISNKFFPFFSFIKILSSFFSCMEWLISLSCVNKMWAYIPFVHIFIYKLCLLHIVFLVWSLNDFFWAALKLRLQIHRYLSKVQSKIFFQRVLLYEIINGILYTTQM